MSSTAFPTPIILPPVVLLHKEHKLCLGCHIKSLNYAKAELSSIDSVGQLNFKKEDENFRKNYRLKSDEISSAVVSHIYHLAYKASFVVYHEFDSPNCCNFKAVRADYIYTPEEVDLFTAKN